MFIIKIYYISLKPLCAFFCLFVSGFAMLWMEVRVLHVLDTCSTTEILTQNRRRGEQECWREFTVREHVEMFQWLEPRG